MTRGGARSRSGPPPDPNALRRLRKDDAGWTTLSRDGRGAPAPDWPLVEPSRRELELWDAWWAEPVALIWEQSHTLHYVAFTVRMFAEAEQPKARTEDRKSLNQMMANLYMTPDAMARARLRIEPAEETKQDTAAAPKQSSSRSRLTVVPAAGEADDGDGA